MMMCGTGLPHPETPTHMCSPGSVGQITPLCYDDTPPPDFNHWSTFHITRSPNLVTCSTCITILEGPPQ